MSALGGSWSFYNFGFNLHNFNLAVVFYCNTVEAYSLMFRIASQRHTEINVGAATKMAEIISSYAKK